MRKKREKEELETRQIEQKAKLSKYVRRKITRLDVYYDNSETPERYEPYTEEALKNMLNYIKEILSK